MRHSTRRTWRGQRNADNGKALSRAIVLFLISFLFSFCLLAARMGENGWTRMYVRDRTELGIPEYVPR